MFQEKRRASAVSAEDHTPRGHCFMADDGQIYWQPTPQHNPFPRGYNQGSRPSHPVLREAADHGTAPQHHLPAMTQSRSTKSMAPDTKQVAAKPVDSVHGVQQSTAEADTPERKPSVLLFLACSVAFIALAVAVILVYTFGAPGTARRLRSPRFCGDVPSWRTSPLKSEYG
ncbi:hypothetical protein MTO96_018715 [Rhipicephalus appendiculatus]